MCVFVHVGALSLSLWGALRWHSPTPFVRREKCLHLLTLWPFGSTEAACASVPAHDCGSCQLHQRHQDCRDCQPRPLRMSSHHWHLPRPPPLNSALCVCQTSPSMPLSPLLRRPNTSSFSKDKGWYWRQTVFISSCEQKEIVLLLSSHLVSCYFSSFSPLPPAFCFVIMGQRNQ